MTHEPDNSSTPEDPDDQKDSQDQNEAPDPKDPDKAQGARKERVLHTRVPAVLELELKRLAQSWRVPVSNVVRAILEDAVAAVDVVGRRAEGNLHHVVDRLAEQRERLRTITHQEPGKPGQAADDGVAATGSDAAGAAEQLLDVLTGIIGFQSLRLATTATCSKCGRAMRAGEEAYLGVREGQGPRVLVGAECLPSANEGKNDPTEDES